MDVNLLIAGTIRNNSKELKQTIIKIEKSLPEEFGREYLVVESDSDDVRMPRVLRWLKAKVEGFSYLELGNLKERYPHRTDRIAFCRNKYLDEFRNKDAFTHLLVLDLDGVNKDIQNVNWYSIFDSLEKFDVVSANQPMGYYDLFALRHHEWMNSSWDKLIEFSELNRYNAKDLYLNSRRLKISPFANPIIVESAFGGAALYKRESLLNDYLYKGSVNDEVNICEHVALHKGITELGYKIAILPSFINNKGRFFLNNIQIWIDAFRDIRFVNYWYYRKTKNNLTTHEQD